MHPPNGQLAFDAATHTYRVGGRVLPHVTEIIRSQLLAEQVGWEAGMTEAAALVRLDWECDMNGEPGPIAAAILTARDRRPKLPVTQEALDRGTAVHLAAAFHIGGCLDWASVDPRCIGRVKAVERFLAETSVHPIASEHRMASDRWRFAGCADLVARQDRELLLFDWKGSIGKWAVLQLAAYRLLWLETEGCEINRAAAVEVNDCGNYHCEWHNKRELVNAGNVFLNMLSCYNWKAMNRLISNSVSL